MYIAEECKSALQGEQIPENLGLPVTRVCLIRGIRYHPGFATTLHGTHGQFTRAINARSIMSNTIPEMKQPQPETKPKMRHPKIQGEEKFYPLDVGDEFPYCI